MEKVLVVIKVRTEYQDIDKNLETVLQSYFPKSEDREKIIQLFKPDLIDNKLYWIQKKISNTFIH
jgi:hypothetical protein